MKKDDIYRSQFRLPYSLYEKLKEASDTNNRSVNAELIARLEESFLINDDIEILREQNQKLASNLHENIKVQEKMREFITLVEKYFSKNK